MQNDSGSGVERSASKSDDQSQSEEAPTRSKRMVVGLILFSVGTASIAQITLKYGMTQVVGRSGSTVQMNTESLRAVFGTPAVWVGLFLFVCSAATWLAVLSRTRLSFAYPFAAITYVVVLVHDFLRGARIGSAQVTAILLIVSGVILLSRGPSSDLIP